MYSEELKKLHTACFPGDEAYADYFFDKVGARAFLRRDETGVAAAAYVKILSAEIFGTVIQIPFVTGVATRPDARKRGHCRALLSELESAMAEEGYPFVMLHPFNHDFYSRLGYVTINEMKYIYPSPYGADYVIKPLTTDDWADTYFVRSEWGKMFPAHVFRSASDQQNVIDMFTKVCGSGYIIYRNGTPNAYVLMDDGKVVEAEFTTPNAFDGVKELLGKRIPIAAAGGENYSMGKLLNLSRLLRLLPMRGVDLNARFSIGGKTYEITVNDGQSEVLAEVNGSAYPVTEGELLRTALGHGKDYPFSPLKELFPEYNLALFEKY